MNTVLFAKNRKSDMKRELRLRRASVITLVAAFQSLPSSLAGQNKVTFMSRSADRVGRPKSLAFSHRNFSSFKGAKLHIPTMVRDNGNIRHPIRRVTKMLIDPWSVSSDTIDALAAQFFAASLFPYLIFLYFLGRKEVDCPKLANLGFRFLLVFVFATIPAGIYAKVHYHDILANIDWLHGGAESLLTITNFLIVLGFRKEMMTPSSDDGEPNTPVPEENLQLRGQVVPALILALSSALPLSVLGTFHAEPGNALSFPTWIIHVSSLIEWLVAMGLVWKYADASNNSKWKGLTWAMIPLHTSGICACTYHFFYNAPSLNILVALQAALTCFGNTTIAIAAFRIWQAGKVTTPAVRQSSAGSGDVSLVGFEDMGVRYEKDSNPNFFYKVLALSCVGSAAVKWGSLAIDAPFKPSLQLALSIIFIPTLLNMCKWAVRSRSESSDFGGFL